MFQNFIGHIVASKRRSNIRAKYAQTLNILNSLRSVFFQRVTIAPIYVHIQSARKWNDATSSCRRRPEPPDNFGSATRLTSRRSHIVRTLVHASALPSVPYSLNPEWDFAVELRATQARTRSEVNLTNKRTSIP